MCSSLSFLLRQFNVDLLLLQGMTWPLTNDGYLKFCRDVSFKNTIDHPESGQRFSSPPNQPDYDQWSVSPGMKHELDLVKKGIYGREGDDMSIETYRLCW